MFITPVDKKKEKGIWVDYFGVELRIARYKISTAIEKFESISIGSKNKKRFSSNIHDIETRPIMIEVLAETVLIDWRNFSFKNKKVPYSKEAAITLMTNDLDLLDFISSYSMNINNYLLEDEDKTVGE